jgi:RNA polymerase sigma-70 factor (ECF subfamily)
MVYEISDEEAAWRVRSGDTTAYEVLAARYDRSLHRVARRVLRSEADADDVVQQAHLLALSHIDQYRGSGYFRWMYSIVVNEARTQMRKTRHLINIDDSCTEWLSSSMRNPEQQALAQDAEQLLERVIESLPSAYQPVFRLREMEDLTTAETGERLGLTGACVKTRLFRAKNILRRTLKQDRGRADLLRPPPVCAACVPNSRPPGPAFEARSGMQPVGVVSPASTV